MRRLLLAVAALAVLAPSADAVTIATVNQDTSGSAFVQAGRLSRDGFTSTCAAPTAAPSVIDEMSSFRFRNHTLRSLVLEPVCFEVDLESACPDLFSAAYAGTFDPANPRTNYAADMGTSTGFPAYSFEAEPERPISVVVHETVASPACGAYTITFRSRGPWAEAVPSIAGDPSLGTVLTGTDADWAGAPAVQRRWMRCDSTGASCADIPGAIAATYTVTEADLGSTLRFRNDATDADATHGSHSAFVEPYIPFDVREGESLGAGDRVHTGIFVRSGTESRCGSPTTAPAILDPTSNFLYDAFGVGSLLNESVCLVVRTRPACGFAGATPTIYNPAFAPASGITTNYAAHSGAGFGSPGVVSTVLPAGEGREVIVSHGSSVGTCDSYGLTLGADAPFATARPSVAGDPVEGGVLTGADGAWSGAPGFTRSWLRCDAAGAACAPIPGATGAAYTPAAADVGRRLRLRVTATQGRSVSSDSEPSGAVAAAPRDVTAPRGTLRLGSRNLRRAVRSGRVPVKVTCDEACSAAVSLRVTRRVARRLKLKSVVIARVRRAVPAGRATTLRARLTRRARRALRKRSSLRCTIAATLTDAAGNASRPRAKAALRRPRRR